MGDLVSYEDRSLWPLWPQIRLWPEIIQVQWVAQFLIVKKSKLRSSHGTDGIEVKAVGVEVKSCESGY